MPWDEDGTDYDEPKSGGDSHEDEFDEEYGEQQPKGDPDKARADELAAAFGADIEFWENQGSDNRQQDRPSEPDYSPFAREVSDFDDFSFTWATESVAGELGDANRVAQSSRLDADGFEPAKPFEEARDDTSVSFPFPQRSPDRSEPRDAAGSEAVSQAEPTTIGMFVEPPADTGPFPDSEPIFVGEPEDIDPTLSDTTIQADSYEVDIDASLPDDTSSEPYVATAFSDPATEFSSDISNSPQSTEFLG
jgi:hypothetical protein